MKKWKLYGCFCKSHTQWLSELHGKSVVAIFNPRTPARLPLSAKDVNWLFSLDKFTKVPEYSAGVMQKAFSSPIVFANRSDAYTSIFCRQVKRL